MRALQLPNRIVKNNGYYANHLPTPPVEPNHNRPFFPSVYGNQDKALLGSLHSSVLKLRQPHAPSSDGGHADSSHIFQDVLSE